MIYTQKIEPFVAFIMNKKDYTFEVHLVNPTDIQYVRVFLLSGAFCSLDDDGLLETGKVVKEKGVLLPHSSIVLDASDWDELDFVIWYNLDLYPENSGTPTTVSFDLPKYGGDYDDKIELLPVLEKKGVRIELVESDRKIIEETIKTLYMEGKYTKSSKQIREEEEKINKKISQKEPSRVLWEKKHKENMAKLDQGLLEGLKKGIQESEAWHKANPPQKVKTTKIETKKFGKLKKLFKTLPEHIGAAIGILWVIIFLIGIMGFLLQVTGIWHYKSKDNCTIIHHWESAGDEPEYINCD